MNSKNLEVDYLARVEGEGALYIKIKNDAVQDVQLKIFEPPRFFEAFLRGRNFREVPDITARICGICPVAYQMSSVHALEMACGVEVGGQLRALRRLLYCGEWIESHTLHVYMLHGPDFLGFQDAIAMAKDHTEAVKRGLQLKKVGNEIVQLLGGREVHPVNVKVGGFYRVPHKKEFAALTERLKWGQEAAIQTVKWVATLPVPDFEQDYTFVALHHPAEYPFNEGRVLSSNGLNISVNEYERYFTEEQVPYSNALHSVLKNQGNYLVGPLARYNLNFAQFSPLVQEIARQVGLPRNCRNPFQSIVVRSLEILFACEEALKIIEQYEEPDRPDVKVEPQAGEGFGCTEAPRGILYHRYRLDEQGTVLEAKIVPPTSQNQGRIEEDLRHLVEQNIGLPSDELTWQCEQAIRNYDPCISCATHFLKLNYQYE